MVKHAKSQIKSRPKIAIPSLAPESKIINKPKTRKGKKILENKQPKIVENDKKSIFIRGGKTSNNVS